MDGQVTQAVPMGQFEQIKMTHSDLLKYIKRRWSQYACKKYFMIVWSAPVMKVYNFIRGNYIILLIMYYIILMKSKTMSLRRLTIRESYRQRLTYIQCIGDPSKHIITLLYHNIQRQIIQKSSYPLCVQSIKL